MATCGCGSPIPAGDLFCTACGKPVAASRAIRACPTCGRQPTEPAAFCSDCGAALDTPAGTLPATADLAARGFQWKWALLTIPIVVGVTVAAMVVGGVGMAVAGVEMESETAKMQFGVAILMVSMLLGGMLAGWLSPGRTIVEPGCGIAATLTMFNVAMGNMGGLSVGWVLPFLVGAAGAWIGEQLPKRAPTRPR